MWNKENGLFGYLDSALLHGVITVLLIELLKIFFHKKKFFMKNVINKIGLHMSVSVILEYLVSSFKFIWVQLALPLNWQRNK